MDRLFEWKSITNAAIQDSLAQQKSHVVGEYEKNFQRAVLNLNEQGLNVALYWKNPDPRKYVNIVPTSAITGEGIPDMLQLVVQLTQVSFTRHLRTIKSYMTTLCHTGVGIPRLCCPHSHKSLRDLYHLCSFNRLSQSLNCVH